MTSLLHVLWFGVALWAAPASAHAVLQSTEPADRQVLSTAPAEVTLTFNEPVTPIAVQILDGDRRVLASEATSTDGRVRIPLPQTLSAGTYIASWRVTSLDSHPVAGSLIFAVGAAPSSWATKPADDDGRWRIAFAIVRALLSASLLLSAGGAFYIALLRPAPALHPLLRRLAWSAIALSIATVGMQGGLLRGGVFADLLLTSTWRLGADTTRGASAAVAIAGLAVMLLGLRRSSRPVLFLGALAAVGSVALTGHTGTADPRWLMGPLLALHVALAAFWLGSLVPLLEALRRRREPRQALAGFSRLALVTVPALIFLGIKLAIDRIGAWNALTDTPYGLLLTAKAATVAAMLGLAALNKWVLTPRLPKSADRLSAAIRAELALGVAVLMLTAVLAQTPPPATAHDHAHDPGHRHGIVVEMDSNGRQGEIEITPGLAGRNLIVVRLDLPADPKEVAIELTLPAAGIEPIRRVLEADNGAYVLEGPEFAIPGIWRLRLDVLIDDFDKAIFEADAQIR